jgi:hypothetical protein
MTALIREFMITGARILAFATGNKFIVLVIQPREGNYSLVTSPDLPGFALVLEPGEADDLQSIVDALSAPLQAYLEVENKRTAGSTGPVSRRSMRPSFKLWGHSNHKAFAVASCA